MARRSKTTAVPGASSAAGPHAAETIEAIRRAVCAWFARAQRRLPWRDGYDPYQVWIAEIMLQQTQVETVRPYFARWLARFPDVAAVAAAPLGDVLKAWEGLGYYARARNLHRAAQVLMEVHGGRVPADLDALRALPGVGRYTAGAIYSIGFDRPAPIVDGNVGRVLGRVTALGVPVRSPEGQRTLWKLAEDLVPDLGARDFNQGLMELGALVCRPTAPDCGACPLGPHCAAFKHGNVEAYPPAPERRERPQRTGVLLLLVDTDGRLLLRQRAPEGIWGGLWEPPWEPPQPGERPGAAARRLATELGVGALGQAGAEQSATLRRAGVVDHGLTHFALRLHCYRATGLPPAVAAPAGHCWADPGQVEALPLTRPARKALSLAILAVRD